MKDVLLIRQSEGSPKGMALYGSNKVRVYLYI